MSEVNFAGAPKHAYDPRCRGRISTPSLVLSPILGDTDLFHTHGDIFPKMLNIVAIKQRACAQLGTRFPHL